MPGTLRTLALIVLIVWMVVDNFVVFRRGTRAATSADRASLSLILVANTFGMTLGTWLAYAGVGSLLGRLALLQVAGFGIMLAGIALRSFAIYQLGRYHMPNVATYSDHQLMDRGLYGVVRHPSYLGALVAFIGYGFALGSWLSPAILFPTALAGYLYRIRVEEAALLKALGERYLDYSRRTRRLVPWVY